ncbi:MAG: peptidylprolyl isomerase [Planctomycetes bacterium]|nr:peptidylprolyl isomerase [Planctomycetota bacterium]MCB9887277.1 peptidylprolyl isomerase [Planctomycetota bacterium]
MSTRSAQVVTALSMLAVACAGAPRVAPMPAAPAGGAAAPAVTESPPAAHPPVQLAPNVPPELHDLGPEILLPAQDSKDDEVARVGDLVLRKSHAFTRLSSAHPNLALTAIDLLVFDVLVARHAEQFGIRVDPRRVETIAQAEEQTIRGQVGSEFGGELDFGSYVWRIFGMRLSDWQQTLRLRTAQRLYQGYVIRYLGLREDRVQVRFLSHKDEAVAREVAEKVRAGADFGTLALRWSEDGTRRDGGLLPPFGKGFQHPIAEVALTLKRGEVSEPFKGRLGDSDRWFVVYCLDRMPGRDVPFAAVQAEIDKDLADNPLTQIETAAYTLRWRSQLEKPAAKDPAGGK